MKKLILTSAVLSIALAASIGYSEGNQGISDSDLGLSKTSVLDSPAPPEFQYRENQPFSGQVLPRAYPGAPPQIPHDIQNFLPITRDNNVCLGCHQQPDKVGQRVKGQPTPIPASHYADLKANQLNMGRYTCVQCHTPQATTKPLVDNTFKTIK